MPNNKVGLCGRRSCPYTCRQVCHCELGRSRARQLLAQRRLRRRSVVGQSAEQAQIEKTKVWYRSIQVRSYIELAGKE